MEGPREDPRRLRRAARGHRRGVPGRRPLSFLLDTHVLLWLLDDDPRVAQGVVERLKDPRSPVFVSAASAWEIAIKQKLGKLDAPPDLIAALDAADIDQLPLAVAHALAAGELPLHHRDPFDRMLVAQAQLERLTLVTGDPALARYDVEIMPASDSAV